MHLFRLISEDITGVVYFAVIFLANVATVALFLVRSPRFSDHCPF
jgi:hypothetical protein